MGEVEEDVLYNTLSVCPSCALSGKKEKKDVNEMFIPASLVLRNENVKLTRKCIIHNMVESLACSDPSLLDTLSGSINEKDSVKAIDIEDLLKLKETPHPNFPFIVEVPLYRHSKFPSEKELRHSILRLKSLFPPELNFMLLVSAKMATDMSTLNQRVDYVRELFHPGIVLLEATFERLLLLSRLQESVLMRSNVYPVMKYYVEYENACACLDQLNAFISAMQAFKGIHIGVLLSMSPPFPDLTDLMNAIRQYHSILRFVVFSLERSPIEIRREIETSRDTHEIGGNTGNTFSSGKQPVNIGHEDDGSKVPIHDYEHTPVCEATVNSLMKVIQTASDGQISPRDFLPGSLLQSLEPIVSLAGFGHFRIRPPELCSFVTCLVNTDEHHSIPITRLINIWKFRREVVPLIEKLGTLEQLNFVVAGKLRSAMVSCGQPGVEIPDLLPYVMDEKLSKVASKTARNTQILLIHNCMDVSCVDMTRRQDCALLSLQSCDSPLVSNCLGFV